MTNRRPVRLGRILFVLAKILTVLILLGGLYAITHDDRALDWLAAIYSVAVIAMAAFITWNLGAMAQDRLGGD